jgi:chromosomal replication initiation ATPase DnaA
MQKPSIDIQFSYKIEAWVSACCEHIGIHRGLIVGNSYDKKANEARELIWLILQEAGWSYRKIALYFYRSHSAIISGIKYIKDILTYDQDTQKIHEAFKLQYQTFFQS